MRRWLIAGGVLFAALAGALVVAAFNLNAFLEANRDRIADQARSAVGRDVAFGEVGVSFSGGLGVRVRDLRVGDDPAFSDKDFLSADAVDVQIAILPALLGRIEVGRVVLRGPSLTVIQTAKGLSTASLGGASAEPGEPAAGPPALLVSLVDLRDGTFQFVDRTAKPPAELRVEQLDFSASDVSLAEPVRFELFAAVLGAAKQNLQVSGKLGPLQADDPSVDLELRLDPLILDDALRVKQVASALPAGFSGSGAARVDVDVEGTLAALRFDLRVDARDADFRVGTGFEKARGVPFSLSARGGKTGADLKIEPFELVVAQTRLTGRATVKTQAEPRVAFAVASGAFAPIAFGAGAEGDLLRDLALEGDFALPSAGPRGKATVRSPSGSFSGADYRDLALDLRMANQRIDIEKLSFAAFEGTGSVRGHYDQKDPARPSFDLATQLSDMSVVKLLESQAPGAERFLSGKLGMKLDLAGAGATWEAMKPRLSGTGSVRMVEGVIRDFNPAGPTFRAIMALPNFSSSALRAVLEEYPQVFGVEDTPFEILDGQLQIRDGWVDFRNFALKARDYVLSGQGRYSLDNAVDLKTVLTLSETLSQKLVAAQSGLRYLRTPDGRLALPVGVRGTPPKLMVVPDMTALARAASGEALTGLLEKALGGKARPAPSAGAGGAAEAPAGQAGAPPAEAPAPAPAPAPSPEEVGTELIRRGLGELLRDRSAPKPEGK